MKGKLTRKEYVSIASMLFGLFFGAGNLIFPVHMGQMAGSNVVPAVIGLLFTGVGMPLLAVTALGMSRSSGVYQLSSTIGKKYGAFFSCLLYLTIGPFFAIPRLAATSFTVGIERFFPENGQTALWIFSLAFFAATLALSLRPGKILTWVGLVLNPIFLVFLGILVLVAMIHPAAHIAEVTPEGNYVSQAFFTGFLEGYNTMDVLAGLAFGIVVVQVIRDRGVQEPEQVAKSTMLAGVFSCILMALIYIAVTVVGTQSRGLFATSDNGGIALAQIAEHYLGTVGYWVLAATVTTACLKTAVGLVTSCSEAFTVIFPKGPKYRVWAILFVVVAFLIATMGLTAITQWSLPILMFLYPLAITLILLTLLGRFFDHDRAVYISVTALTLVASLYDLMKTLPEEVRTAWHLNGIIDTVGNALPFAELGLAWICPAALGLVIGLVIHGMKKKKA